MPTFPFPWLMFTYANSWNFKPVVLYLIPLHPTNYWIQIWNHWPRNVTYNSLRIFPFPRPQWRIITIKMNCTDMNVHICELKIIRHYCDVRMGANASQITSLTIVYSTVYSGADQRQHQSSASLAFVRGIHRRPVNSPHKWPVTQKMFPFDDVIMKRSNHNSDSSTDIRFTH